MHSSHLVLFSAIQKMQARPPATLLALMAVLALVLTACGGGGAKATAPTVAAPDLIDLGARTLTKDDPANNLVFTNNGGAPNPPNAMPGGCTGMGTGLPAGLAVTFSTDGASCAITGAPTAVTPAASLGSPGANSGVTVTVTATNAAGSSDATVLLVVLDGTTVLTVPAEVPALIAGTPIATDAFIVISSGEQRLAADSCAFVSGGVSVDTLDGLVITTVSAVGSNAGPSANPDSCRVSGTPVAGAVPGVAELSYDVTAAGISGGRFTVSLAVSVVTAHTSPDLPATILITAVTDGIPLAQPISIPNSEVAADITACFFIDGNDAEQSALDGFDIIAAADGRACQITGTPAGLGEKSLKVRARSAAGLDEATVIITVTDAAPVLAIPSNVAIDATIAAPIENISIINASPNLDAALAAGNCVLLDEDNAVLTVALVANTNQYSAGGLTLATDTAGGVGGACVVSGSPDALGETVLRIRADNGDAVSNIVVLTFTVSRQADAITFAEIAVTKKFGDGLFTNVASAASGATTFGWTSSDQAVATVDATTGEVTVVAVGTAMIVAVSAQSGTYEAASAGYVLTVNDFPPELPMTNVLATAVDGVVLSEPISVANAVGGADITDCFFVVSVSGSLQQMTTLDGVDIAKAADGRACEISGTLSGVGAKTFAVRALSAGGGMDMATVVITVQAVVQRIDFTATVSDTTADGLRTIRFTPTVPDTVRPTSWRWDFGDGSAVSEERAPVHIYVDSGTYTVQMDLTADDEQSTTVTHKVYASAGLDTLKPLQWYLDNSPASPFVAALTFSGRSLVHTAPTGEVLARAGEDIRAPDYMQACGVLDTCRGEGVVIQIVDRAVQLSHPDLVDNTRLQLSKNQSINAISQADAFSGYGLVSPLTATSSLSARFELEQRNSILSHGTATAGIAAARDLNGRGITGVAPRAELAGYNYLDNQTDAVRLTSITDLGLDVSNNSWSAAVPGDSGPAAEYLSVPSVEVDAIEQVMAQERGGLGRVFVKSAGNSGAENSPSGRQYGNRQNASGEALQNLRYILAIGAIDADGEASESSEGGANILTVAYENQPCGRIIPFVSFVPANPLAIVTTDPVGDIGAVYTAPKLLFGGTPNQPELFEVPDDILDYNYCFSGTSASAPMVSGAAALLLQARPDLSWRDVRAIIARSARRNDTTSTGWAINGANLATHYQYGFGALDVSSALELAREWQTLSTEIAYDSNTITVNGTVPDATIPASNVPPPQSAGSSFTTQVIPVTQINSLESVQVEVRLSLVATSQTKESSRALRGTVSITLEHISPTGELISSSILHKHHPYYANYLSTNDNTASSNPTTTNPSYIDWTYLTLRHFGEAPTGTWRLRITDFVDDDSTIVLESWRLVMHGY